MTFAEPTLARLLSQSLMHHGSPALLRESRPLPAHFAGSGPSAFGHKRPVAEKHFPGTQVLEARFAREGSVAAYVLRSYPARC